jgi:hypothetical protein
MEGAKVVADLFTNLYVETQLREKSWQWKKLSLIGSLHLLRDMFESFYAVPQKMLEVLFSRPTFDSVKLTDATQDAIPLLLRCNNKEEKLTVEARTDVLLSNRHTTLFFGSSAPHL